MKRKLTIAGYVLVGLWVAFLSIRVLYKPKPQPQKHVVGLIGRTMNLIAGTNMTVTQVDNTTTGRLDVTISNTSSANVSSVNGAGTVSCSPTTGAVVCTGSGGSFTCSNLNPCAGGQLPAGGIGPGPGGTVLFTNLAGTTSQFLGLGGDIALSSISGSTALIAIDALQGASLSTAGTTNGDVLTFITGTGWTHSKPQKLYANVSGSTFPIGTSLSSCTTIGGVVVGSGQQAYVTAHAWVASTDGATPHSLLLNITNVTNSGSGQVGQVDLGPLGDATVSGENIDNSVGTFTYATQLARTGTLATGTVTAHWCSINVEVQ
jgi:hypothetical protein